jgi:Ca2+-binding RTX toxin-like protein
MARLVVRSKGTAGFNYDRDVIGDALTKNYAHNTFNSTVAKQFDDANNYIQLDGSGFTKSGSGTIESITIVDSGVKIFSLTGLSVSVATLIALPSNSTKTDALFFDGNDTVVLTPYADLMRSGAGDDVVYGGKGNDSLAGGSGHDKLVGEAGDDKLFGQSGNDRLIGGSGHDKLSGGAGEDKFIYDSVAQGGDTVSDFSSSDVLMIEGGAFGLGTYAGTLRSSNFATRSNSIVAFDSTDRFVFNKADHTLWYDSDGKGGKDAVLMVDLGNSYNITHADIMVI